jgi:dolichol kinase
MDRGHYLRRAIHMMIALAPIYYLIPEELPYVRIPRWSGLIIFLGAAVLIEVVRLVGGITFMGLRPHEARGIASFVWAAAGITIALWVFPPDIATAALVGMAFVDPLAGELRRTRGQGTLSVAIPVLVYFVISAAILSAYGYHSWTFVAILGVIGATSAVGAERWKAPKVDDDFLMIVLPGLLMWAFSEI